MVPFLPHDCCSCNGIYADFGNFNNYTLRMHSTSLVPESLFDSSAMPTMCDPEPDAVAQPPSSTYTGCPLDTGPATFTGTRPFSATACPSLSAFIRYAGALDITPTAMFPVFAAVTSDTSAVLTIITVPTSYS